MRTSRPPNDTLLTYRFVSDTPSADLVNRLAHVAMLVSDYDEALAYYVGRLGFTLVEDMAQPEQNKRWVTNLNPLKVCRSRLAEERQGAILFP